MNEEIKKAKEQLDFLKNGTHSETFFENHEYDIDCALKDIENALIQAEENEKELTKLKEQYKNIHNTKVKVPLCDILNGLTREERYRVIEDIYYSHIEQVEKLQNQNMELEEKYCDMDIKAKRYEKFAQIVIKKNVDILYLKHAHKLATIEQSLENYNTYKNDNEDELNLFELGLLVGVVDEMREKGGEKV